MSFQIVFWLMVAIAVTATALFVVSATKKVKHNLKKKRGITITTFEYTESTYTPTPLKHEHARWE